MPDDFGKFITKAQNLDRTESRFAALEAELEPDSAKKRPKFRYLCRVFTVFRPWQECQRCQRGSRPKKNAEGAWVDAEIEMSDDADYICPHNESEEYMQLVNRCAANEVRLIRRAMETLKTGVVQALIEWGEPLHREQKEEQAGTPRL